ncbi:MAG: zinc-binding dehydrogenase [Verrucomicrobiota bacterium]
MKFKAAVLVESKKPLVIEELEVPRLTFGQVLVRVITSGICGAQINEIDAVKGPDRFLPHLQGHEATAEVLECGEGVTTVAPGDRVICHWRPGSGLQAPPASYDSPIGKINAGWVTTFNEMAVLSENRVTRIPSDFDPEIGALMGCAVTTAIGVVNNDARVKVGESVVIFGAGGVGLALARILPMVAAYPIIAVDLFDHKLERARELGATHTINATRTDPVEAIRDIVGPHGADVVLENSGQREVVEQAYEVTAPQGRMILVGVPHKGDDPSFYTLPLFFGKVLTGSHGGESKPDIDIPRYVRLCQTGRLDLSPLIGKRYPLEQINRAMAEMRAGEITGRCMINLTNESGDHRH